MKRLLPLLLLMALAAEARADRRAFTFIYEPKTMAKDELEIEWYMTGAISRDFVTRRHDFNWTHQIEVEYGIRDNFDLAMYQMFAPNAWLGYKVRARYLPWERGLLPADLLLYFEFIHLANGDVALEEKVIIGRNFGPLIIALDTMVQQGPLNGDVGFRFTEGLGIGYEIAPWLVVGLENQLRLVWEPKRVFTSAEPVLDQRDPTFYTGPTVSLASQRFWWNLNFSFRAVGDDNEPRYLFRVLWGIFL